MSILKIHSAPSNIALIKYMGKINSQSNLPSNASFSYTLEHLRTFVTIESIQGVTQDLWEPLQQNQLNVADVKLCPIELSEKGKNKFLNHFKMIKEFMDVDPKAYFLIRSANNFPSDCGIASSSSSFAALTKAAVFELEKYAKNQKKISLTELSALSRKGSGSSCRSFFSPWCQWKKEYGEELSLPYKKLHHLVLLLDTHKKEVSSSDAHLRVVTSPIFRRRMELIESRFEELVSLFENKKWQQAVEIARLEFEEMHALFETSVPAFSYRNKETVDLTKELALEKDILVTMDAGSNVHLLFRDEDFTLAKKMKNKYSSFQSIASWCEL